MTFFFKNMQIHKCKFHRHILKRVSFPCILFRYQVKYFKFHFKHYMRYVTLSLFRHIHVAIEICLTTNILQVCRYTIHGQKSNEGGTHLQYIKIDFCEQHTNQVEKKILSSLKGGSKYSSVSRYQNMNEIVTSDVTKSQIKVQ